MLDMLKGIWGALKAPRTFSEYVAQQLGRGLLNGPPVRADVLKLVPRWLSRMARCERLRAAARAERGLHVPSVLFLAVTGRCNLRCRHCYTQRYAKEHMALPLARRILGEARELGVAIAVVSGGEPLLHRDFFQIPGEMPDVPFIVFTNGALVRPFLDDGLATPNMLWVVSVDGPREWNDARRGEGSYDVSMAAMDTLRERRIPFGFSVTMSGDNVAAAATPDFVGTLVARGCRSGFFLEQIPSPPTTPPLAEQIEAGLARCRAAFSIPIIGFPADELRFGGCQAGGNGIAHISPDGYLEPCPAARLAADCLQDVSLAAALSNPFFQEFRDLKDRFAHEGESCSYSGHEETFERALDRLGARSTV
ncbi:MAG TPA: radical SAM protein [Planctomycetota bacterium]|nr:radical SAM protein [Planctomycetota bacterium]